MHYTITLSRFSTAEVLVAFTAEAPLSEILRGRDLAESLRGRWSIRSRGHLMTPGRAAKWEILFKAGWRAEATYHYNVKAWTYTLANNRNLTMHEAINLTRRINAKQQPQSIEV